MLQDWLILDVETAGREDVRRYVKPDSRLVDPKKIEASITERAEQLSLDVNGARIVAIGVWPKGGLREVILCRDAAAEVTALEALWKLARWCLRHATGRLLGFRARQFDLPMCIRRSQLLGVPVPHISLKRYNAGDVFDLYEELTFHEGYGQTAIVPRTLDVFCEQFGITVTDPYHGSDIGALVAAGSYDEVRLHCDADLQRTWALAARIGVIEGD